MSSVSSASNCSAAASGRPTLEEKITTLENDLVANPDLFETSILAKYTHLTGNKELMDCIAKCKDTYNKIQRLDTYKEALMATQEPSEEFYYFRIESLGKLLVTQVKEAVQIIQRNIPQACVGA